ncbi:MAG: hypothetical protein QOI38_2729 [Sphingomonadales bacterium]|jgi:hypothetical protein|nr:hypothetical protein [Sphingomonadales bacterium]
MASRAPAQAAPAPARAAEPGSTNRAQTARKAAKTGAPGGASSGVVNVASSLFEPSQAIAEEIEKAGPRGLDVRVIAKGLTDEGLIKVRQDRGKKTFESLRVGTMPLLNPWTQKLGGMHLNFEIDNSAIKNGYASFKPRGGDRNDWLQSLKKDSALLGGLGLNVESLPKPVNKFEQGKLMLGVSGMKVVVGGYVDASFDLLLENMEAPKVSGSAEIDIRGAAKGKLTFDNPGNVLRGSVSLAVNFKSFSGAVMVAYRSDGTVDISGSAAYSANKLSGEIQFVATDLDTANKFAKDALAAAGGKDNVQNAGPPSPVPVAKEGKKKRALAATGRLSFNLTTWFAGAVNVVVDGKGEITVIGKIAPPGEIILFPERAWNKEIVKFEARAYYGIPVVGNLNLFANISLAAIAKLGPARLYAIEILGTYSTDPEIQKDIQISGSINISAYGGLRLRAEGGAGIELLAHDLKFGIGLNADVGVKAYADARPTIGYRDPGLFYVSGTLDLVAQPMLGLGGEFFIALDAPWFSPLSDKRWSWPLFSKEWPLGDPIGMSATLKDYVLGSGKVPEIELKPPEFDPSKFMTNMVDDKLPAKSGGAGSGRGTFKEDGSIAKPVVKPKRSPPTTSAPVNTSKKGKKAALGKSARPDTKAANDAKSTAILKKAAKPLTDLKGRGPVTRGSLDQELGKIRKQVSGIDFGVRSSGAKWLVSPKAGGMAGKGLEIGAKSEAGPAKGEKPSDGELGKTVSFSAPDGGHRIYLDPAGTPMLASQVKPLTTHLRDFKTDAKQLDEPDKSAVTGAITTATPMVKTIEKKAKEAKNKAIGNAVRDRLDTEIEAEEEKLRPHLITILDKLRVRVPAKIKNQPFTFVRGAKAGVPELALEYTRQLKRQEGQINAMSVHIWIERRAQFAQFSSQLDAKTLDARARKQARTRMEDAITERLTKPMNAPASDPAVAALNTMPGAQAIVASIFKDLSPTTQRRGLARSTARAKAEEGMQNTAMLHEPDKVAGGRYEKITDIGQLDVNNDIGANWGGRTIGLAVRKPIAKNLEKAITEEMKQKKVSRAFWRKVGMDVTLT